MSSRIPPRSVAEENGRGTGTWRLGFPCHESRCQIARKPIKSCLITGGVRFQLTIAPVIPGRLWAEPKLGGREEQISQKIKTKAVAVLPSPVEYTSLLLSLCSVAML